MKKIIIAAVLVISGWAHAGQSDNPYIYDEPDAEEMKADGQYPTGPTTDPIPNPIDQYIPILALAALGLAVAYGKAKKTTQ